MAGMVEQAKGQAKEAVGALTGNKDLESDGKADRRAGETKEKVRQVKDKTEGLLEKIEHKAGEVVDKAKDALHRK
ncbi:MAG: CsbD family protein [Frankiaceae bacterium]|nr:CsbD family protein [Frankiaceae bacterium]